MGELIGLLVPLSAMLIAGLAIWSKHQRQMAEIQLQATAEKAAQYASHTTELEERVRVLERIVTDKGYDVATQIEALRDARRTEALIDSRESEVRS